ncbi:unnamed protein product [Acanthoscelides obtectus]|uniref:Uncharacterized protein n=1 Tax=Acanthoscelides obtectus TaxID=200917 RepID=A0A9P0L4J4_ACAOB|nr:unnamed protein product [Acanthoscelides obtectus]CAK1632934.1 hypothetical protein AOBTE_LOCUS7830 [Acanthoscelides obtectus]
MDGPVDSRPHENSWCECQVGIDGASMMVLFEKCAGEIIDDFCYGCCGRGCGHCHGRRRRFVCRPHGETGRPSSSLIHTIGQV